MDKAVLIGDKIEKAVEKRLIGVYSEALKRALQNEKEFLNEIALLDEKEKSLPKEWTSEQIKQWRRGYQNELIRRTQVVNNIAAEFARCGTDASMLIRDSMVQIYGVNREFTIEQIQNTVPKVNFTMYDKNQIRVILEDKESPFSKLAYKKLGEDRQIVQRLGNELAQATVLGESQRKIIERIRNVTGQSIKQAKRVAQTERTRVQSQGRFDTVFEAANMGIVMFKRWSTRMVNSRDWHISLNGAEVPYDKPFIDGEGNELMYPGDPSAPANTVINCFCVMVPIVKLKRG